MFASTDSGRCKIEFAYLIANPAYASNDQEEDNQRDKVECAHCEDDV